MFLHLCSLCVFVRVKASRFSKKTSQFRIVSKIFEPTNRRFHTKQTMLKFPPKLKFSSPIPIQLAPRFVFPHNIFFGCSPNLASPYQASTCNSWVGRKVCKRQFSSAAARVAAHRATTAPMTMAMRCDVKCKNRRNKSQML